VNRDRLELVDGVFCDGLSDTVTARNLFMVLITHICF
jgi:hypothetical protein